MLFRRNKAIATPEDKPKLSKESELVKTKQEIEASLGKILLALMNISRYRDHPISTLRHFILEPLVLNKIAIAHSTTKEGNQELAGVAIWASVSEAVDLKIREQIKQKVFPVQLNAEDWQSGETIWLLDLITPSSDHSKSVLSSFYKIVKKDNVQLHPIVASMVAPEIIKTMGTTVNKKS